MATSANPPPPHLNFAEFGAPANYIVYLVSNIQNVLKKLHIIL